MACNPDPLFPVVVLQDRYCGLYSGGEWLAVANADTPYNPIDPDPTRAIFCQDEGPNGTDEEAKNFWRKPPRWVAAAASPNAAVEKLCALANA